MSLSDILQTDVKSTKHSKKCQSRSQLHLATTHEKLQQIHRVSTKTGRYFVPHDKSMGFVKKKKIKGMRFWSTEMPRDLPDVRWMERHLTPKKWYGAERKGRKVMVKIKADF